MAGGLGREPGGIRSLRRLIAEHKEAVEYDLIALDLRLDLVGTERLSWRDLLVLVNQAPRGSALFRSLHPDTAEATLGNQILAQVFNVLTTANWQRQGKEHAPRPEPYPLPWLKPEGKTYGRNAVSMDEMDRLLGWEATQ